MQKPVGHPPPKIVDKDGNHGDSKAVDEDRDWCSRCHDDGSLPKRRVVQVGQKKADTRQRQQVAKTAAGFSDFESVLSEINNIAFDKYGKSNKPDGPYP